MSEAQAPIEVYAGQLCTLDDYSLELNWNRRIRQGTPSGSCFTLTAIGPNNELPKLQMDTTMQAVPETINNNNNNNNNNNLQAFHKQAT